MTKIQWTEATWNPIVGCSVVSPGCCTNCYAMLFAAQRLDGNPKTPHYAGTTKRVNGHAVWTGKVALAPDSKLLEPLRRKKPTTYFVNSMGDLFHEDVPDAWIDRVFAVMALCPQHTFQVLTKRAARMREYCSSDATFGRVMSLVNDIGRDAVKITLTHHDDDMRGFRLPNIWLGVSCEDQTRADARIPDLLATPAAVRFVSAEPLLGPVDFRKWMIVGPEGGLDYAFSRSQLLHWVIVGGESGKDARPMHPDWARSIRDQCRAAGVPFFFKQHGGKVVA